MANFGPDNEQTNAKVMAYRRLIGERQTAKMVA